MKSRISVELDFNNGNQPIIQIQLEKSDDVRDKILSHFTQQFGGSSWCQIRWQSPMAIEGTTIIHISPINPGQFKEQAEIMLEQDRLNRTVPQ